MISRDALTATLQDLFTQRNEDGQTDFEIVSQEGCQIKVHSLILFARSDFFKKLLTGNWIEKDKRSLPLPLSTEATTQLVKFLYGFELEAGLGLDTLKELISYGGVCAVASLQDAAGSLLGKLLNKENVFQTFEFSKQNKAKVATESCLKIIVKDFDREELMREGYLEKHPEIAIEIIKNDSHKKKEDLAGDWRDCSVLSCHDKMVGVRFDGASSHSLKFRVESGGGGGGSVSLHGVGLSIVPGSRVDVNIAVAKWSVKRSWEKIFMHTEKNLVPRTDIAPVYFKAPVTVSNNCKITVTVNGTGFAFGCNNSGEKKLDRVEWSSEDEKYVKRSGFARGNGKPLEFRIYDSDQEDIIPELYFSPTSANELNLPFSELRILSSPRSRSPLHNPCQLAWGDKKI